MPQSLAKILLHVTFSTKNRAPLIPEAVQADLYGYIAGTCRGQKSEAYRVGGTEDHLHIACTLPRTLAVSKLVQEIKASSSAWIKQRDSRCREFAWQAGYGAFSLGQSQLDVLIRYIDAQHEHHKTMTFQEEFIEFLKKYEVDYDERYIWD